MLHDTSAIHADPSGLRAPNDLICASTGGYGESSSTVQNGGSVRIVPYEADYAAWRGAARLISEMPCRVGFRGWLGRGTERQGRGNSQNSCMMAKDQAPSPNITTATAEAVTAASAARRGRRVTSQLPSSAMAPAAGT